MAHLVDDLARVARGFRERLDDAQRAAVQLPFTADDRQRWTYLPGDRPGVTLERLDAAQRRAALALLWTVLAPHAFAQAVTITALDDVLAQRQPDRTDRGAGRYTVAIYGEPGADAWAWRFEGHHLSVNVTVVEGHATATPLFFGANPARTRLGDIDVVRPLPHEEELARALLRALPHGQRDQAIVAAEAPRDISSGDASHVAAAADPAGLPLADLGDEAADIANALIAIYRQRLAPSLMPSLPLAHDVRLAWAGGLDPAQPHAYRIVGGDLVIEYANTQDGANHIHSVIRGVRDDFGRTLLARHASTEVAES